MVVLLPWFKYFLHSVKSIACHVDYQLKAFSADKMIAVSGTGRYRDAFPSMVHILTFTPKHA